MKSLIFKRKELNRIPYPDVQEKLNQDLNLSYLESRQVYLDPDLTKSCFLGRYNY
jgi:hypothetical protein